MSQQNTALPTEPSRTAPPAPEPAPLGTAAPDPVKSAWVLSALGLVPFVVLTAAVLYAGTELIAFDTIVLALSGYGAVILSFLGGIRWGAALTPGHAVHPAVALSMSVLPALLGWAMLLTPSPWNFAGLAFGFAAQGVADWLAARRGTIPPWFGTLRVVLSVIVTVAMGLAFLALR